MTDFFYFVHHICLKNPQRRFGDTSLQPRTMDSDKNISHVYYSTPPTALLTIK